MLRVNSRIAALTGCALMLAISLAAANPPAARAPSSSVATAKANQAARRVWPPETLSGKITMVDPSHKLVVVQAQDGIPFDLVVTGKTSIKSGTQAITLNDLSQDLHKSVSVKFVPESRGDVARSININS